MESKLIVFFSAEGTTAKLAEQLSKETGADLFEIKPENPYTAADIKWTNLLARCNREKIGKKDVPIAGSVENWDEYQTVFLGFPIWYYGAPNIIQTFVKDFDWAGKKIYLFATSGGSEMNKTAERLLPFMKNASIAGEKLVKASEGVEGLKEWVKSNIS